jgi:hypothetical protein
MVSGKVKCLNQDLKDAGMTRMFVSHVIVCYCPCSSVANASPQAFKKCPKDAVLFVICNFVLVVCLYFVFCFL